MAGKGENQTSLRYRVVTQVTGVSDLIDGHIGHIDSIGGVTGVEVNLMAQNSLLE